MQKETKETGLFCHIFIIGGISMGGGSPGYAYVFGEVQLKDGSDYIAPGPRRSHQEQSL